MTEKMTQAARVIAAFGGRATLAARTGYTYAQIRHWDRRGFVPCEDHQRVLDLAYDLGLDLTVTDLYAHLEDPFQRDTQSTAAEA